MFYSSLVHIIIFISQLSLLLLLHIYHLVQILNSLLPFCVKMLRLQQNSSGCSNKTSTSDWDFSFSERTSLALFLAFLGCSCFSATASGLLLSVILRYRRILWQAQYFLVRNMSVCSFGMSFTSVVFVLSAVVREQPEIYGCWCISQFCILRSFFLMSQMTLALMAVERYIFICHGIHYLRMINTCNVLISLGLLWLISVAVSIHGGFVLSQILSGFQQPISGLMCNAVTIKEHIKFSLEENLLAFGPPSVITTFCTLTICCCYGGIYHAALRVSKALKCSNHRASRTVGFYFLLFLLQFIPSALFVVSTLTEETPSCRMITHILRVLLMIIPSCVNPVFLLIWNPQIKQLLLASLKCGFRASTDVRHLNREEWTFQIEERCQAQREDVLPPLPDTVVPSDFEDIELDAG